jgi:hypothetical protein
MKQTPTARMQETLRVIIRLLVDGQFEQLERMSDGVRLRAHEIEAGVNEYPAKLVFPPEGAFELVDIVPIRDTSPAEYSIRFPLYTHEEGQSDLELQATLIDVPTAGLMRVELDNIIVP